MSDARRPQGGTGRSDAGTWLALFALVLLAGGFLGLTAMVFPQFVVVPLVVFGFVFVCVFHYVTWGRWLGRRLRESQAAAEREAARSTAVPTTEATEWEGESP